MFNWNKTSQCWFVISEEGVDGITFNFPKGYGEAFEAAQEIWDDVKVVEIVPTTYEQLLKSEVDIY